MIRTNTARPLLAGLAACLLGACGAEPAAPTEPAAEPTAAQPASPAQVAPAAAAEPTAEQLPVAEDFAAEARAQIDETTLKAELDTLEQELGAAKP
jgi:hypothetical protein